MDAGSGTCDDEGVNALSQQIWQLYSKDVEGGGWAETVAEDHSDAASAKRIAQRCAWGGGGTTSDRLSETSCGRWRSGC